MATCDCCKRQFASKHACATHQGRGCPGLVDFEQSGMHETETFSERGHAQPHADGMLSTCQATTIGEPDDVAPSADDTQTKPDTEEVTEEMLPNSTTAELVLSLQKEAFSLIAQQGRGRFAPVTGPTLETDYCLADELVARRLASLPLLPVSPHSL